MAIDTPATIAVLGGGPIGLEAALYARYLGYEVQIYERGRVCSNMLEWGHVRMFSPVSMNITPLGIAALKAQDAQWQSPDGEALLTGREMAEQYFLPLAASDLLVDNLHEQTEVLRVGREGMLKGDLVGDEERRDSDLCLLVRGADGRERMEQVDAVIDATGTWGHHNWLGEGGIPAIVEMAAAAHIEYKLPDVLGGQRNDYEGKQVLVVGSGYSAATTIVALAELARQSAGTQITWITRRPAAEDGPVVRIEGDRLKQRDALAAAANQLARKGDLVRHLPGTSVRRIAFDAARQAFELELVGASSGTIEVERVVANVGYRPDRTIYEELQVHECYATGGPMKQAAALLGHKSADCLTQPAAGPAALLGPEPDFYILGAKSYGRDSRFLLSAGFQQIRDLFTIIGEREDLDLYASMSKLL